MFVDSHAHLDGPDFSQDLSQVLGRARQSGLKRILAIGCVGEGLETVSPFLELLQSYDCLVGAMGIHPHDARYYTPQLGLEIERSCRRGGLVGWGEIGLDFHYDNSPRGCQIEAFRHQLRLARASGLPVIIHSREAEEETCRILEEECGGGPGGVLHCFTGSREMAERCLELGFYIAFGGILTFPRSHDLRRLAAEIPLERILIETDSPYLAPVPYRGRRNEPAWVVRVAEELARLRHLGTAEVGVATSRNFGRLFGLQEWETV